MRFKLGLSLFATSLVTVFFCTALNLSAQTSSAQTTQGDFAKLRLDSDGCRGIVLFNHRLHEGQRRPGIAQQLSFELNPPANTTCIVCHHPIKQTPAIDSTNDVRQYQRCTNCHFRESNPPNPCETPNGQPTTIVLAPTGKSPVDRETGKIELNSREAFHRMCISCHQVSQAKTVKLIPTKCAECHDQNGLRGQGEIIAEMPTGLSPDAATNVLRPVLSAPISTGDVLTKDGEPAGYAGESRIYTPEPDARDREAVADRWRQGVTHDPRYLRGDERFIGFADDPRFRRGRIYNPYNQNVFKGDYPIIGQQTFLITTFESLSFVDGRRLPVPSGVSSSRPNTPEFFGRGEQFLLSQDFVASFELFHGDTSFKPIDWRVRFTPVFNINYLNTQENGLVNINPALGTNRFDTHLGFQELFGEVRLGDTTKLLPFLRGEGSQDGESPYFDSTFIRTGIQQFQSDFRGFIFNDFNLGTRLFGQAASNRYNFNAAYFYMLEKDTNSQLNRLFNRANFRNQSVFIANIYRQDTFTKGYTTQFSFHFNDDRPSIHFDNNDFLVRPALIGSFTPHGVRSYYFGWAGDGHIDCSGVPAIGKLLGQCNVSHAFYQVVGHDSLNPIAGIPTRINAQMAAAEISKDRDWIRFKGSFFWASGDKKPFDNVARGFDSIVDLPEFAGGIDSFWQSNPIPFGNTAVLLTTAGSLLPDLRSSKTEGQSNFVNPGIFIYNTGIEADLTQKLRGILNLNYLHFAHTESLEDLLFQPNIRRPIGVDYGIGFLYRPKLSENIVIEGGFNSLIPGTGFKDIYSSICSGAGCGKSPQQLFSVHLSIKLAF